MMFDAPRVSSRDHAVRRDSIHREAHGALHDRNYAQTFHAPTPKPAMTEPVSRLQQTLADRYRIERALGKGGMATVYLAENLKHDRMVAIKMLRPELTADIGTERFLS
jgi:serine/threonine protein kinase